MLEVANMSEGWAAFIGEQAVEETPAQKMSRQARQTSERQDRGAAAAEAERAVQLEENRDQRLLAFHQLGIAGRSQADIFSEAGRLGDEDSEYEAARAVMEKIDRRRASRAEVRRYEAEQLAMASRAASSDDPYEAATRRAHRAFAEHTRALVAEVAAGTPRREPRPKGRGGNVVRSELECWWCVSNNVSHEESTLLHLDPQSRVPITTIDQAIAEERAEHVERRRYGSHAEISR
jgi:hypothetical protein